MAGLENQRAWRGGRSRAALAVLLAVTYGVAFFRMPPFGRQRIALPDAFQICFSTVFLALLAWMLIRRTRHVGQHGPAKFDTPTIHPVALSALALCVPAAMTVGIAAAVVTPRITALVRSLVFLSGMLGGTALFLRAVYSTAVHD